MKKLIFLILLLMSFQILSQDTLNIPDSSELSLEEVIKLTLSYHPTARQASLISQDAKAKLTQARGGFDPKLEFDYDVKNFKQIEYYNLLSTTLKVPTWIGIDPKAEFVRNTGDTDGLFLNDQNSIPASDDFKQLQLGVSIPLGKGMFFDERRNTIRQAEAFLDIADAEKIKTINKVLVTVIKDYWEWFYAHQNFKLLKQAQNLSQDLFSRTLLDFEYGEASAVDTLQAKINLQKRTVDLRKSEANYRISILNLGKHLWSATLLPLEIKESTFPIESSFFKSPDEPSLKSDISFALENHPEIKKLEGKQSQLSTELKWAKESLKPQVDLSYSFINAPLNQDFESETINLGENYKLGLDFSLPLLIRKERGKLQQTKVKITDTELELAKNQLSVKNNVLSSYTMSVALENLLIQYEGVSENYKRLLEAEIINLENGETDLFKLNIQQDKYIEAQTEYYLAFIKWEKSKAEYLHTIGIPYLGLQ